MNQSAVEDMDAEPVKRSVSLDEALEIAGRLHRSGELDDARVIYEAVLEQRPDDPAAQHFLGVLLHQRGDSARAVELIRRAIDLQPDNPGAYNNLGNVLLESGQIDAAVDAYRRCLELAPEFVETHNNLGTIYRARGELAAAESAYAQAIGLRPDFTEAYCNMANLRFVQGRTNEAAEYACRAITQNPAHAPSRKILAVAYYKLGEVAKATEVYREWLREDPDNPIARHHLAACSGEGVPTRADDAYIEETFDAFAGSFDSNLEMLNYRAPDLVAEAIDKLYPQPGKQLRILDAGCGTGLCGQRLVRHAAVLIGVDLSAQMLVKAEQRQFYDKLIKAELTAYLASIETAYVLIVSADTLCYFGALEDVLRAAYNALDAEGRLIFTVEDASDTAAAAGYRINPHGRYSHTRQYVELILVAAGFRRVEVEQVVLRNESGKPVAGLMIVAHKQDRV